jgi:hypothetical protein
MKKFLALLVLVLACLFWPARSWSYQTQDPKSIMAHQMIELGYIRFFWFDPNGASVILWEKDGRFHDTGTVSTKNAMRLNGQFVLIEIVGKEIAFHPLGR